MQQPEDDRPPRGSAARSPWAYVVSGTAAVVIVLIIALAGHVQVAFVALVLVLGVLWAAYGVVGLVRRR
jgi:Flp pilus assembly protein TadB